MKKIKLIMMICFLGISMGAFSQSSNTFLDRSFWKAKPNLEEIKAKVKEGHSPSELTAFGFDAVTSSFFAKVDNSIVKYLLSFKENGVNKLTHDGRTYIFWAAYAGNIEMMKYLLANGADTKVIDDKGYSILTFAAVTGQTNPELYDLLIAHGANVKEEKSKDGANALLLLIPRLKDFTMVEYFQKKGIDLHSTDKFGNGAFNYTARTGNIKMLQKLIDKGIAYKGLNKEGGNAVLFASEGTRGSSNGMKVYSFLENLGLKMNVTTHSGTNPLHNIAYKSKDLKVYDYFLGKGVSVNQQNEKGNTPFMHAASYNTLEVIKHLKGKVKDLEVTNKMGQSALTLAVKNNKPAVIEYFLSQGANAKLVDKKGNNLAYYAIKSYRKDKMDDFKSKIKLLQKIGVDFKAKQQKKNTLLHLALEEMDLDLLEVVFELTNDVNAANEDGLTPLHIAAMKSKNMDIIKFLIQKGAQKDVKTPFGETPFDLAAENELLTTGKVDFKLLK